MRIPQLHHFSRHYGYLRSYFPRDPIRQFGYAFRACVSGSVPIPPAHLRVHVQGSNNVEEFLKSGKSVYLQMGEALEKYVGTSFYDYRNILDFGVGCGRLERWFESEILSRLTGVDVSKKAIRFCTKKLKGKYLPIGLNPPMPLAENVFDLVISFSVFSHMDKSDAESWVSELYRVTKPGAILLVTTHMEWCAENYLDAAQIAVFENQGMCVIPYRASGQHHDKYVNAYFSRMAWTTLWNEKFELLGIGYGRDAQEFVTPATEQDIKHLLPMGQALSVFRRKD